MDNSGQHLANEADMPDKLTAFEGQKQTNSHPCYIKRLYNK